MSILWYNPQIKAMELFGLNIHFPVTDPTWIFFLVLIIILFAPMILGRLRIPHIIGMILAMPIMSLIKVVYRFFATKYDWFNSDIF